MKILMLTWEYPPRVVGGIARVVYDLSKTLLKDGHDVTVVTYREGDAPYFEDDKGVKVYRVDNYMINPNNFIDWIMQLNFNLIAAMPKILNGYHDSKLIICGKGGMLDELKAEAERLGISQKVYFAGYMQGKDVQRMYKAADIAVFPSTYEPFGIVALEAMLSENPVVVSDVGGLNEIVQHKENGMKSYAGNPNSIADSILELLYDHKLCADITKRAKNRVRNEYNWNKIAQDTHFAYQKAICQSVAEKQKRELEQERAKKTKKTIKGDNEITNLLNFRKRQAYA